MQPHPDICGAYAQGLGDFVIRETAKLTQNEDCLVAFRKLPYLTTDAIGHFLADKLLFRRHLIVDKSGWHPSRLLLLLLFRELHRHLGLLRRPAAKPIGGNVGCNPVEPRRRLRVATEAGQRSCRFGKYRLGEVF